MAKVTKYHQNCVIIETPKIMVKNSLKISTKVKRKIYKIKTHNYDTI